MCNLSSAIEREGIAIGGARGEAKGNFEATARYFRRGVITAEEATSDLGMTEGEFLEKAVHFEEGKLEKK